MPLPTLEEQFLAEERERLRREREQTRQARAAASIAQPANPERTAQANKLAREVGQPPALVEQEFDQFSQYRRTKAAREVAAKNEPLGEWLGDERNAALAQDDVGILEGIGDTVAGWLKNSGASKEIYENAQRGVFASDAGQEDGFFDRMGSLIERGGAAVDEGIYNFIAGTTGSRVAQEAAQTLGRGTTGQQVAGQTDWEAVKNKPSLANIGGYIIDAGAESIPAMTALAIPVAGIGIVGVSQTGNIAAERAANNGRDEISGRDIATSLGFGFGSAALDRLGFKGIFSGPGKNIGTRIGRAAAGEAGTEFLQSSLEYAGGTVGTDAGFDIRTALDQGVAGAVAGAGLGGGIRSTVEVARSARSIEAVDRLMTRAAESQVRQRDPESFRALIEKLTGQVSDGNLYVSGEAIAAFNQDYADDEFWGQFSEEIDDARLTGGDVAIPLSRAASELSGKPDWDAIKGDVRAAPGAMTLNEIEAAETEWETIRKEAGDTLDAQEREARAAAAPGERLRASIRERLMTSGMDPDQAAANAEVSAALFETEAANLGYDLTGREFEKAVSVQRVLPGLVADPEAADTLDVVVNAMRGAGDAEIGVGSTLMEFIRERGGINDPGGDLRSMGVSPRLIRDFNPDQGSLAGVSGAGDYGIDSTMRAAIEAGFFPDLTAVGNNELDTQRMLDAIGSELSGSPVYSETRLDTMRQAGSELRELLASAGVDPDTASMSEIREAVERFDGRALYQTDSQGNPLVAVHNLSADKFRNAEEIGGLAAPSMAVIRADVDWSNFGDITLIASPAMIDPARRDSPGFNADVYSPRQPRAQFDLHGPTLKKLETDMRESLEDLGRFGMGEFDADKLSREGLSAIEGSDAAKLTFLRSIGENPRLVRDEPTTVSPALAEAAKGATSWQDLMFGNPVFEAAVVAELKADIDAMAANDAPAAVIQRRRAMFDYDDADNIVGVTDSLLRDRAQRVMRAKEQPPINRWQTSQALDKKINATKRRAGQYKLWVQENYAGLIAGRFFETRDSGRRKEYTMQNLVREMTRTIRDGEGYNYGVGSLRSNVAQKFRSIADMQASRNKIIDDEAMNKIKDEVSDEMFALGDKFKVYHGAGNDFGWMDIFTQFLKDVAIGRPADLREWQNEIFTKPVPDELLSEAREFLGKLRDLPTEYFETKMQRAVSFDEFKAAVVPDDTAPDVVAQLEEYGLRVENYPKGEPRTDAVLKAAGASRALFQRGQGPQGQIQFDADGQALIRLFESANASTFQHEMAHFWLERTFANARRSIDTDGNPAARQTFADVEQIKAWFKDNGHPVENDVIPTEAHEMFARAWEQYLMEGKAPTARLQNAFRKFSRWLKRIYRTVANLNTPITPEIREVMDRMLATEQEIAQAAEARAAYLQFDDAIAAGMSEADARRYAELGEAVRSEAEEHLTGKVMRSIKAQGQKQWREQEKTVRGEVEEMVDNRPPFAALKLLRQKDGPRIDKAWLQENFGEDVFGILPAGMPVWKQGGTNPDTLAELTGFSSGDQLVRELIGIEARRRSMKEGGDKRPVREAIIAQEVKAEMNRRFGDPLADGTIEREASAAVQNDRLGEKVELELRALGSKTSRKPTPYRMAREWARGRIEKGVIADMVSGAAQYRYTRTAAKAARDAQSAILAGDMDAAFKHKQTELLHNALAREAAEAAENVDKAVRRLGKFAKQTKAKTLPLDYLDRIHTLLEGVEFKKVSQRGLDRRKALREWIAAEEAEGRTVELPERVLDEIENKNWSRLTVDELMLLDEAVKQIAALGRLKTKLLTAQKDREVEAAANDMEAAIIGSKKGPKPTRTRETLGYRAAMAFKSFKAMHRKMASLAREMDSVKDGGPVWDNLIRPMMERFDQEAEMNREATEALLEIMSPFYGRDNLGRPKMGGKGIYFESIDQSFNLEERMAIVGQMGNAGNLQRLLDGERGEFGYRWSMEQLNEIKASLTKEQMDAVQAIWDLFESYRPLIAAKERRVSGVEPEWVEPVEVETEHGTYKGGYWPIKYDPARSTEAQKMADAQEAERQLRGAFTAATTQRSFTKQRADRVTNRPLLYSFSGVTQGLTDVVHDLAFHEYLIDANRLLRHPKVSSAMLNYYGPEIIQQFRRGIEDVAAGSTPAQNVWEQGINHVRMGATVAGLGWNLKTALLQPFGLTQSIVRVGAPWIARGVGQMLGSPLETSRSVYEKSRFMRERSNTMQREISEIRNRIRGGTKGGEFLNASFFLMITRTQLAIDLPTWQGAYEKAFAETQDEALSVSRADQSVRDAQGGGQIGDLSAIQRGGPLQKLFTNFYSFFNTTYNLTAESYARTDFRKPADVMALALDYLLLYSLPAAMGMLLNEAFAGEDDDDDRTWWEKLASEHISYMTGTMVGLRELDAPIQNIAEAATGAELNQYDFGYTGPAGLRFFADGTRAAQQASQGEFDDALRKSMINTGGIVFHLPSGQINKSIDGGMAIANDDTDNPMALVSGN